MGNKSEISGLFNINLSQSNASVYLYALQVHPVE